MRKFLIIATLWLGLATGIFAADTFTLADGTSVSGDIVKTDDNGAMIHNTADAYNTIPWAQFSQDSLKHLAENPKLKQYVEPFIEPTAPVRPPKPEIKVHPVERMQSPAELHPSIVGGLVHSSLGLFILLVVYSANLYAAFEIAVVRSRPIGLVMGVSAVLPIIGPILFVSQPVKAPPAEEAPLEEGAPGAPGTPAVPGAGPGAGQEEIQIVSASWQAAQEEKKPQPQVFSRGKFTLNRRFIETKFAGFVGEPKGDAKLYSMELKTLKDTFAVECIKLVGPNEVILETPNGQVTVPFSDIQEVKLIPKPA